MPAFRPAFQPAFQAAFRPPFGASGAAESALQQAVIAAWDMQEESGPLLPAKGDIEIPAFNSPGTAAGPISGITSRSVAPTQSFEITSSGAGEVFDIRGGITFAGWLWATNHFATGAWRYIHGEGPAALTDENAQWALRCESQTLQFRVRQTDGSVRVATVSGLVAEMWFFFALSVSGGTMRVRLWDGSALSEGTQTLTGAINPPPGRVSVASFGGSGNEWRGALNNTYAGELSNAQLAEIYTNPRVYAEL